ncbi:unnamed protein product [Adineta steineri]|uniref:Ion transport domain-containing protein n=1 Tax=Adineta steineri TaxID=433720 RepID=A0A814TQL6_9BILA|nr:unnamed protein product [Adineta steineri]CAF1163454.1 unnamed protein product [Adineta steineri]
MNDNINISHTSLPTIINISNDDSHINETDHFINKHNSLNNLSDICNLNEIHETKLPFPGFIEKSFYCLRQTTLVRYQCLKLLTWPWFEHLTMFIILLNCITLGMYQPCAHSTGIDLSKKCDTARCISLQTIEYFIFAYFIIEMSIKMVAMGIFGKGTYLAESWNRLDCFIVLTGLVELLIPGDSLSLSAIRTVRVLRPLRAINRIPSMRILVMLLLDTLPMLGNVLFLCFFVFFIFGIIGVQLWNGLLRNRCFFQSNTTDTNNSILFNHFSFQPFYVPSNQDSYVCSLPSSNGMGKCSEIPKLHQNNITCELDFYSSNSSVINKTINSCINWNQYYRVCATSNENPYSGVISFDNIALAWIAIFQIITLENWVSIMYYIQDAHSFYAWIYFVCLIVIGTFFMMNLCLVAISAQFSETKKRETERMLAEQKRFSLSTTMLTNDQQNSCWKNIIEILQQLFKYTYKRFRIFWKNNQDDEKHRRKVTITKDVLASNENIIASTSLINRKHQPNCRFDQSIPMTLSKSIDSGTDTCDINLDIITSTTNDNLIIEENRQKNQNLECEQQEGNDRCSCYYENNITDTFDDQQSKFCRKCKIYCCCKYFQIIQKLISHCVNHKYFDRMIFLAIIVNTLSMAIEHHKQPQIFTIVLEYSNLIFTILFTIEMLLKIIAQGFCKYIQDPFNAFDGGIVLISLIELYGAKHSGLSVLRTFRLLRVLKLVRFMPILRRQLVILLICSSVLGMHLFGGEFCTLEAFNKTSHEQFNMKCRCCTCSEWNLLINSTDLKDLTCIQERANFDSLRSALITVFQILTQEDWNEVLYNGMKKTTRWSVLYFIALMIFGNYILINLLIAIVVEGFSDEKDNSTRIDSTETLNKSNNAFTTHAILTGNIQSSENINELTNTIPNNDRRQNTSADLLRRTKSDELFSLSKNLNEQESNISLNSHFKRRSTIDNSLYYSTNNNRTAREQENNQNDMELNVPMQDNTQIESKVTQSCLNRFYEQRILKYLKKRENYSLYLFSPSNRLRNRCQRLIKQKTFDYFILFLITINCITLAMERPSISPTSYERKFLNYSNYIFAIIFIVEMMIKVIASGLIVGRDTYLHTGWNVIDGLLVITSIVDFTVMNRGSMTSSTEMDTTSNILGMLRVFRLLRTLRPLRVINRAPGLKLVVQTLLSSLKPIGHIVIICCVFFVIFGILGVQLFKGKFYYCEGPLAHDVRTKDECEAMPDHQWQNQQYNFDNLGQALLTLFVLSSKDGWVQIMYNGIDAVDVDKQPIKNYSEVKLIYFLSFILIVSFFVLNMFVGVVVKNFHNCRAQQEIEEDARNKLKREKKLKHQQHLKDDLPYYANFSTVRKNLHDLFINKYFDLFIAIIIILNIITMSVEYYSMPPALAEFLECCNYIFTVIFLIEFLWKIIAFGPSRYFKDKWNQLDFFIVVLSIGSIVMEKMKNKHIIPINPTLVRIMRVLRITRILKLLKIAKGIQALLDTIIETLPQIGNLGFLFFLLFFIFATLGVELFGRLECNEEQLCSAIDKHANFQNFGMALLTLFRIATGDNWNSIMKDTLRQDDLSYTNKYNFITIISPIYFVIFILMAQFVLLNVVVAVLMKKLEDSNRIIHDNIQINQKIQLDISNQNSIEQSLVNINTLDSKDKQTLTNS